MIKTFFKWIEAMLKVLKKHSKANSIYFIRLHRLHKAS